LHGYSAILDVNEIREVEAKGLVIEVVLAGIVEVLVDEGPGEGWRYVGWDVSRVKDFQSRGEGVCCPGFRNVGR
jgi:hypothetical protein